MEDGMLMVACPNQFTRKSMIESYQPLIEATARELYGSPILVNFCVG